jgi:hypothetical protein
MQKRGCPASGDRVVLSYRRVALTGVASPPTSVASSSIIVAPLPA